MNNKILKFVFFIIFSYVSPLELAYASQQSLPIGDFEDFEPKFYNDIEYEEAPRAGHCLKIGNEKGITIVTNECNFEVVATYCFYSKFSGFAGAFCQPGDIVTARLTEGGSYWSKAKLGRLLSSGLAKKGLLAGCRYDPGKLKASANGFVAQETPRPYFHDLREKCLTPVRYKSLPSTPDRSSFQNPPIPATELRRIFNGGGSIQSTARIIKRVGAGQLKVRMIVSESGKVEGCYVLRDFLERPSLADRTCRRAYRLSFSPSKDGNGNAVKSYFDKEFIWSVKKRGGGSFVVKID